MKFLNFIMKSIILIIIVCNIFVQCVNNNPNLSKKKSWKDKDISDMNEADLERLFDQWEENDEPLEPDELPEHLRPSPKIDLNKLDMTDKDSVLKMTKKGKGVMMFVNVRPEISITQADISMRIWHTSLHNNHIIAERYPLEDRRCIFLFPDGSQAIDAKNFLIQQPELAQLTLEGQVYEGQYVTEEKHKQIKNEENKKTEL